jgi:quercetin dioxygenase-like cupin family protein
MMFGARQQLTDCAVLSMCDRQTQPSLSIGDRTARADRELRSNGGSAKPLTRLPPAATLYSIDSYWFLERIFSMTRFGIRRLAVYVAVGAFMLSAGGATLAREAMEPSAPITDTVLAAGMPEDAPGKVLQLERYTIAPGAEIPTHIHPGAYAIYVEQGKFGFTVLEGDAVLTKADSSTSETIAAGSEVIAQSGDEIFENGGVVHFARNAGDTTVIVLTAALLEAGEPSLQPVDAPGSHS